MQESTTDHPITSGPGDLMPVVYERLRAIAEQWLAREPPDLTLQPTALVHEVYLRMRDQRAVWTGRTHFCSVAVTAMRRVLLDHARERQTLKRGRAWQRVNLATVGEEAEERVIDIERLELALQELACLNPRHARVVELRFLAGLSIDETAGVLEVSPRTVKLDWRMARAWLLTALGAEWP